MRACYRPRCIGVRRWVWPVSCQLSNPDQFQTGERKATTVPYSQTLACSLILSRIDYCDAVLHGAPSYSIKKLQRVQNNAARIVLEAPRRSHASPLLRTLHWLPVQQRIDYKVALLTFKVRSTSTPSYLRLLIKDREHDRNLPLRLCVNLLRRQHLRNTLFDALRQLSGTHCRKLFSVVTLLQFLSLGSPLRLSLLSLLTNTLPGPSASEVTTLWCYTNLFIIFIIIEEECL